VEEAERRLLAVAEERRPRRLAEALRDHHGDRGLAVPDQAARLVLGRRRDLEVAVALRPREDRLRDRAAVVIDDRDRDLRRLAAFARAREDRAEERRDRDRHHEADDHRALVAEEELQVLADHREQGNDSHQSRRLLPVSVRNTDSSVTATPGPATRDCSPISVSSAMTLPWSMTTMRS